MSLDSDDRGISRKNVVLVTMPYVAVEHPSIGLGLLKACLNREGISTKVHYACLRFARELGINNYNFLSSVSGTDFLGDWTFSHVAFPDFKPDNAGYIKKVSTILPGTHPRTVKLLAWMARDSAQGFVDRTARLILKGSPRIVGCTSTFQQHVASLALLRRINELDPDVVTMIGGANCEGEMGETTHECFSWVDFVVSGEADSLIVPLCRSILAKGRDISESEIPDGVLGPAHRKSRSRKGIGRPLILDMDRIPTPDYDEYFETLKATGLRDRVEPGLLAEASRGCWWGAKSHCTFCGLNGNGMSFRSKSPDRLMGELDELSTKYDTHRIAFVDNILDMQYFRDVLPRMAEADPQYQMLFETKSNLKRDHLKLLAAAGVRFIQPGIESMHGQLCKQMNKGNNAWINIQLLKWGQEFGIFIAWNFLYGLPGEDDTLYQEMLEWMPMIVHLQPPPGGMIRIRFDRFSVYHNRPQDYDLKLKPFWSYKFNYPLPDEMLNRLAYYFENGAESGHGLERARPAIDALNQVMFNWSKQFYDHSPKSVRENCLVNFNTERPKLIQRREGHSTVVFDSRPCAIDDTCRLEGAAAQILEFCDEAKSRAQVYSNFGNSSAEEIDRALEELEGRKILLFVEGRFVSLPVREPERPLPLFSEFPGGFVKPQKKAASNVSPRLLQKLQVKAQEHGLVST